MNEPSETKANRLYKSRLFEMIFNNNVELLELYNAMNGTNYTNPELLKINTLENAIYLSMHNDISFLIDSRLNLFEHQSSVCPNLPLRYLFYVSDLYSAETRDANLYGSKMIKIPVPRFVIFYNGEKEQPDVQILKLSDMFAISEEEYDLELKAIMLNINPGHNPQLLNSCKTLQDYSIYTDKVRTYTRSMAVEDAVELAITECVAGDILADFLAENRAEVKKVSIYEYDEEKHIRQEREDSRAEGIEQGIEQQRRLTKLLIEAGRFEELKKAADDLDLCKKLYEEFQIGT